MHGFQPTTVLAHGVFDVLHLGHIRHLQEARKQGDRLVVSVTPDEHVNKGVKRPVFTAAERVEALKALDCVDDAFVNTSADATTAIASIKPGVYVKGIDYDSIQNAALDREVKAVQEAGGRFHVTKAEKWSSSRIINVQRLPDDALAYLDGAKQRGFLQQIKEAFARADQMHIAFVGETIIDEYRYVRGLAKPSKEFILATVETAPPEQFLGGVMAASLQAEWPNVSVVTVSDQIRKTRFVDADFSRKLFEVYSPQTLVVDEVKRKAFENQLDDVQAKADIVIALDFGHGLFSSDMRRQLEWSSKFLAVNSQTNAGNHGFNPITKWQSADYICLDEPEARLATGMQAEGINDIHDALASRIECHRVMITRGKYGSVACERFGGLTGVPAFATQGVDTIGAGDAYLAVTSPLVAAGLELEPAAFVGNVAGAIKVSIVGHRRHVERAELMQTIEALLA
jgi:rfaE bifunctional protein nucleotidyltransferase chain/domain